MRVNSTMRDLMQGVDLDQLSSADIPSAFQSILEGGWVYDDSGAWVLRRLADPGTHSHGLLDPVQREATINGRGMIDYDLPKETALRKPPLFRRSIAYACAGIDHALQSGPGRYATSYVSASHAAEGERTLTTNVTFCTMRGDRVPYVENMDEFREEGLMEITAPDLARFGWPSLSRRPCK